jgi:hypothetical protein
VLVNMQWCLWRLEFCQVHIFSLNMSYYLASEFLSRLESPYRQILAFYVNACIYLRGFILCNCDILRHAFVDVANIRPFVGNNAIVWSLVMCN